MPDQNPLTPENQNIIHQTAAPDPSAILETNTPTKPPVTISSSGIKSFIANIRAYGPKHYIARIISIILIIHGVHGLYEEVLEIFYTYPHIPELYKAANFSTEIYNSILYRSLIVTATGVINTVYGVALAFKHSQLIEYFHIITGFVLFIVSYYLLSKVPPLEIDHIGKQGLALLLQF